MTSAKNSSTNEENKYNSVAEFTSVLSDMISVADLKVIVMAILRINDGKSFKDGS